MILGDIHFEERANFIFGINGYVEKSINYMPYIQQYSQGNIYEYSNYNSTYQLNYYPFSRSGFEKQWPH